MDELNLKRDGVIAGATGLFAAVLTAPIVANLFTAIPYLSIVANPVIGAVVGAFAAMLVLDMWHVYNL